MRQKIEDEQNNRRNLSLETTWETRNTAAVGAGN